jgi:hypothetical protein
MAVAVDEDEGKELLRNYGWPEEIIAADDGVTEIVPIKPVSFRLEGLTAIERLDTGIDRLREYATRDGDTARGKEIGLPVLWRPDANGVFFDILWHTWDDWRVWRAPLLDLLASYVACAYPDYRRLFVRSTFPGSTRGKASDRVPVTAADVIAWEFDRVSELSEHTHEEALSELSRWTRQ